MKICILDDDEAIRVSLSRLITTLGYQVKTVESAEIFYETFAPGEFACLILDIQMPGESGHEVQDFIVEIDPSLSIIFLSGHATIDDTLLGFRKGAFDFLLKPVEVDRLSNALERATKNTVAQRKRLAREMHLKTLFAKLSQREIEVAALLREGRSSKEIARLLDITERTVKAHRGSIYCKAEISNGNEFLALFLSV